MKVRPCYATQRAELNIDRAESASMTAFKTAIVILGLGVLMAQGYLMQVAA